ncbi:muscarinic acetylcholine receptor M4-like [Gouania willdenowi]|uniref:muscarinic acetylcholine receptor M4-like n=1 Tax=Gouania willdenowi TaxID=441366 RepID=UPI001055B27A|nr:muscarinic acetylcholine receptor M4 [Gouania willdenowi]
MAPPSSLNATSGLCPCINGSCQIRALRSFGAPQLVLVVMATTSLSAVTVFGNALVILSIAVNCRLRTEQNLLLLSLAVSDLTVGLLSVNVYSSMVLTGCWALGPLLCDLWLVMDRVLSTTSVLHLLLISSDRYFRLTQLLRFPPWGSFRTAGLSVGVAWLLPLLLWAPAVLGWQWGGERRAVPEGQCYTQLLESPAVTLSTAIPSFFLPATAIFILYGRLSVASMSRLRQSEAYIGRLRQSEATHCSGGLTPELSASRSDTDSGFDLHSLPSSFRSEERRRRRLVVRERRVTRTILAVLLAFVVTWTPYNVMAVVASFCHVCIPESLWTAGYFLCYVNSAVNPCCYALCSATFRTTFCSLLRCRRIGPR